MSDYFSVQPLTPPIDRSGVRRLARHSCLDIHQVHWLRSYLATGGEKMLCWYQAHDSESVRLVLRHQDATEVNVWPAKVSGGSDQEPTDDGTDCVVVEFHFDEPDSKHIASIETAIVTTLKNAGQSVSRTYISRNGARLICLVVGQDEVTVIACLQSAALTPTSVWQCIELSPNAPKMFSTHSASPTSERSTPAGITRPPAPLDDRESVARSNVDFDAIIIGAGVAGICALHQLLKMGLSVRVYESANDVGGVWHWNRYPGCVSAYSHILHSAAKPTPH